MRSALQAALVGLVWALVAWPTLDLPWSTCDDANTFAIVERIERAAPLARPLGANRAGVESYPGRFMPLFWIWLWACWKLLGAGVWWHRFFHLVTFLWLALWIRCAVLRAGGRPGVAVLSAVGFLIFAGQYEAWPELQPVEPVQALGAALFLESLVPLSRSGAHGFGRGAAAALALTVCLALKETSLCLGLPLVAATALRFGATRTVRGQGPLILVWSAYLGYLALYLGLRPGLSAQAGVDGWVAHYQPTAANCLATLEVVAALLWKTSGPVVAVGLAGLSLPRRGLFPDRGRELLLLVCAWALGGLIIFLPWSQLAPRHMLWIAVPLGVAVGAGVARLADAPRPIALLALALAAGSLLWMSAQYAVTMATVLARYRTADRPFWLVADTLAARAPEHGRIFEPEGGRTLGLFARFLPAVRGRGDLVFARLGAMTTLSPGDLVLVSGGETPAPAAGLAPVLSVSGEMVERDLPEPRYCFFLLRQVARGARPASVPLREFLAPRLFRRTAGYTLFERTGPPARPAGLSGSSSGRGGHPETR